MRPILITLEKRRLVKPSITFHIIRESKVRDYDVLHQGSFQVLGRS